MLPPRETYRSTGRVDWGRLVVWFVLSLPLALLAGYGLCVAFRNGFHLLFLIPLIAGAVAGGAAWLAVAAGKCRNRWVGAAVGVLAGLVTLASSFQFDLALQAGPSALYRLDLLPGYVRHRVETDQVQRFRRTPPDPVQQAAQAVRAPGPVSAWVTFVLEALCLGMVPVSLGWNRASRPYSEEEGRWLREHLFYLEPEDAREMRAALYEGDAEALAELARPVPMRAVGQRGEGRLYYLPHKADTPVYLSLRVVDTRPFISGWPQKLATRVRLSADEAVARAERLRPPGATFGAQEVLPVPDPTRRAAPAAAIEDLPPAEAGRVLNGRVTTAGVVLALAPLEIAFLFTIGVWVAVGLHWSDWGAGARWAAVVLTAAALVVSLVLTVRYGDGLAARFQQRRLAAAIRQRPGAVVQPDDPDAMYVGVVPRKNWGRVMVEGAEDVGLIKADPRRRELMFEGDRQRWRIPADSIQSCEPDEYTAGQPGPSTANVYPVAVLRVNRGDSIWEAPLSPRRVTLLQPTLEARRRRRRELLERIRRELLGGPAEQ